MSVSGFTDSYIYIQSVCSFCLAKNGPNLHALLDEKQAYVDSTHLKVHCVIFRMIHRQKCNIIYITTFSEEYKDLT